MCRESVDEHPKHPTAIRYATPFSDEIMVTPFSQNFKIPSLVVYDEKGDPRAHADVFNKLMDFEGAVQNIPLNFDRHSAGLACKASALDHCVL